MPSKRAGFDRPPGTIIATSPDFQSLYVGSPSIAILPDGTYVASHGWFGPGAKPLRTLVYASKDKGATWKKQSEIPFRRWSEEDSDRQTHQDESGRLWDVLYSAFVAARRTKASTDTVLFKVARVPRDGKSTQPEVVELKSHIGPGDDWRPVLTIMFPYQD